MGRLPEARPVQKERFAPSARPIPTALATENKGFLREPHGCCRTCTRDMSVPVSERKVESDKLSRCRSTGDSPFSFLGSAAR